MASIFDSPIINQFLFYPRPLRREEFPDLAQGSVQEFPSGRDTISAYWYRPLEHAPTVLMFHGNGEVVTDYLYDFHKLIEQLGANYAVVDYRGYGLSQGQPSLSGILEDGHAAWEHFTGKLGLDPSEIIIMGRSLGSIPALELASTSGRDCRGVVIESGIAGFHRWIERMGPMMGNLGLDLQALKDALIRDLDHEAKVIKIRQPMLIMHTEHDQIVPSWNARDLYSWSDPNQTTLKIFPMGDHNTIFFINAKEYFQTLGQFIGRLER